MNFRRVALLPLLIFVAVGCNDEKSNDPVAAAATHNAKTLPPNTALGASAATAKKTPPAINPAATAGASAAGTSTTTTRTGGLPPELKHEGYEYSGVSYNKPMDMEETISSQPGIVTGSQTVSLKEVKDGKAVYSIDRTGGLANLGTEEWTVTKDGVFDTESSMMDLPPNTMVLPAVPKPGMTWKVHAKVDRPDKKLDMNLTFKIVGKQSVTTKAGTFNDALLVEQTGTGTMQGQSARTTEQDWYVKGLGTVKSSLKLTGANGVAQSITIQETKAK